MTGLLTAGDPDAFQTTNERRAELAADVAAAALDGTGAFDADAFLTRPTVLRRMAALLAPRVPAGVDRIVGREPGSVVLATALTLETGLPLVVARAAGGTELECHGDLHPGERALVVEAVVGDGSERAVHAIRRRGATVVAVLAGVGCAGTLVAGVEVDALLDLDELAAR